jgi:hypothetical protein
MAMLLLGDGIRVMVYIYHHIYHHISSYTIYMVMVYIYHHIYHHIYGHHNIIVNLSASRPRVVLPHARPAWLDAAVVTFSAAGRWLSHQATKVGIGRSGTYGWCAVYVPADMVDTYSNMCPYIAGLLDTLTQQRLCRVY